MTVKATIYNDNVVVEGAKLTDGKSEYVKGTPWKEIVDLSGCTATVNNSPVPGTFKLMEPDGTPTINTYTNYSVPVFFTTDAGKTYQVTVSLPTFIITDNPSGGDDNPGGDDVFNDYYITIYANSKYNESAQTLLELVQTRKGTYAVSEQEKYNATWSADSNNPKFEPKGYTANVWYSYTAAVQDRTETPKAYVRVVPVNATPSHLAPGSSSKIMKATDILTLTDEAAMKAALSLPTTITFKNEPAEEIEFIDKEDKLMEFEIKPKDISGFTFTGPTEGRLSGAGASLSGYADAHRVSDWAADAMSWAVGVGLIKGTTPTQLDPQGSATRAQVATVIMRYAEMFGL